jgi:hypothetical protein
MNNIRQYDIGRAVAGSGIVAIHIAVVLLSLVAMDPAAASGQVVLRKAEPVKIIAPTYLSCRIKQQLLQQGPPEGQITITNDTRWTISRGTTIYWRLGVNKGSFGLPHDLRPIMTFTTEIQMNSAVAASVKAVAWYYK